MTFRASEEASFLTPDINVPRLLADLEITEASLRDVAALDIPTEIRVPSASPIKTGTVADVLSIVQPGRNFNVIGVKVPSDVDEQPVGRTTINGALNRLRNGIMARELSAPGEVDHVAWFSIENGLFRAGGQSAAANRETDRAVYFAEDIDLTPDFVPGDVYQDRAVTAIRLAERAVIVGISPASEAVTFPNQAVVAAYNAEGGFAQHTVGSKLVEMGLVRDKQNSHSELTADRPGGPLSRQDQMARVMIRSLIRLAAEETS
jgi:hypothetical protein